MLSVTYNEQFVEFFESVILEFELLGHLRIRGLQPLIVPLQDLGERAGARALQRGTAHTHTHTHTSPSPPHTTHSFLVSSLSLSTLSSRSLILSVSMLSAMDEHPALLFSSCSSSPDRSMTSHSGDLRHPTTTTTRDFSFLPSFLPSFRQPASHHHPPDLLVARLRARVLREEELDDLAHARLLVAQRTRLLVRLYRQKYAVGVEAVPARDGRSLPQVQSAQAHGAGRAAAHDRDHIMLAPRAGLQTLSSQSLLAHSAMRCDAMRCAALHTTQHHTTPHPSPHNQTRIKKIQKHQSSRYGFCPRCSPLSSLLSGPARPGLAWQMAAWPTKGLAKSSPLSHSLSPHGFHTPSAAILHRQEGQASQGGWSLSLVLFTCMLIQKRKRREK